MTALSTVNRGLGLVAGLVLTVLTAAPGHASNTSFSIGEYYQEGSNITSTSPPGSTACNATEYCYIEFGRVPVGKQLIATHLSCSLSASAGAIGAMTMQGRRSNGNVNERFTSLIPTAMPSTTPGISVVLNTEIFQLFDQRERPEVYLRITTAGSILGFCTLGGQMVDITK